MELWGLWLPSVLRVEGARAAVTLGTKLKKIFDAAKGLGQSVKAGFTNLVKAGKRILGVGGKQVDDVINSATRPSRSGSKDSRAFQALKKKVDRGDVAFAGLQKSQDVAIALIQQVLKAKNPIVRTKTRNGQVIRDVFDSKTGRGVRTIDGKFDTFVNLK